MKRGMTLTSLLVAVALSGIIAVFGGRLVVNQMFMAATAELIDKGDSVMQFYLSALQDYSSWRCTLFDTANGRLRKYMLTTVTGGNIPAEGTAIELRGPDCDRPLATRLTGNNWKSQELLRKHILSGTRRGTLLIPSSGKKISNSVMTSSSTGWWEVNLKAIPAGGRGDIDLELSVCLNVTNYNNAHKGRKQVPRSYRWKCGSEKNTRRVRYSETATNVGCSPSNAMAIVSVTDRHSGAVNISCSHRLLTIPQNPPNTWRLAPTRQLGKEDVRRQGIKPRPFPFTCPGNRPVVHITGGEIKCGLGALVDDLSLASQVTNDSSALCGEETSGLERVLCGFSESGIAICCTPKGPKGPKGLKGCPPVIVKDEDNKYNRICRPNISNTDTCPGITTNYIVTSRPSRCL